MNPVTISVTPALKVNPTKYVLPKEVDPLEDYSMVTCRIVNKDKTYEMPFFLKNSSLPLSKEQMVDLRELSRQKLKELLKKKAKEARDGRRKTTKI